MLRLFVGFDNDTSFVRYFLILSVAIPSIDKVLSHLKKSLDDSECIIKNCHTPQNGATD